MIITTKDFGEIQIQDDDVIMFKLPIFGFEEHRRFVLLHDSDIGPHFAWLQSVEETGLCFVLTDPSVLPVDYSAEIPAETAEALGGGPCLCWAVTVIQKNFSNSTVNLKSPIFINENTRLAAQVILDGDYPLRYPLVPSKEGKSC